MSDTRRLLRLVRRQWPWLALGGLLGIVAIASNIALMGLSAYLISKAAVASGVAELALAVTGVRVLAISRAAFRYLERYTTHRAILRVLATIRVWFYAAVEPLAPARLVDERGGDLLTRVVNDVDALEDFYVRVLLPPVVATVVVAVVSAIYGWLDLAMGLVLLGFLLLTGVVLPLVTRRLSTTPSQAVAALRGDVGALVVDGVEGAADLIVLDAAAAHRDRLLARAAALDRARRHSGSLEAASTALAGLCASLAALSVLALGIPLVTEGRLDGVLLAALPLAAIATFEATQPLSRSLQLLDSTRASARRLLELVDAAPAVTDPVAPMQPPVIASAPTSTAPGGSGPAIDVTGLSFRYGTDAPWVLRDLDLHIPGGTRIAITGPSGCGKSTLLALLLRFWDYETGSILIGGGEIRDMAQDKARELFSVVPQDVHLFHATIRDNLAVADADASLERMMAACALAQLDELIVRLPDGLDTVVGEDGVLLSGGERRRLAVARAVLRDAPIVVLDEVTADLDPGTESALWASLDAWLAGRTVIVVSHRPTDAARVDAVVALGAADPS